MLVTVFEHILLLTQLGNVLLDRNKKENYDYVRPAYLIVSAGFTWQNRYTVKCLAAQTMPAIMCAIAQRIIL